MPGIPTALPDRAKIRALIWARGYSINGVARKIGRPPGTIYKITGHPVPRPVGVPLLRQLASALSTPAEPVKVSDISDWAGDDDTEPEPEALASLDTNKPRPRERPGREREMKPAQSITTSKGDEPEVTTSYRPLRVEIRGQEDKTGHVGPFMITPGIDEDYWSYRVRLTDAQAVIAFPKFGTIGIGFAQEEDWNTNFPYTCGTDEIWRHIRHNKGDDSISDEDCITAIRLVQDAIKAAKTEATQ